VVSETAERVHGEHRILLNLAGATSMRGSRPAIHVFAIRMAADGPL
jgi:hypothetical protein